MTIFLPGVEAGTWTPTPMARGPFKGLQGGAVAGLLVGEIEARAAGEGWGDAISVSAWFLRPVPDAALETRISVVTSGRRLSVVDNSLFCDESETPYALVRVTFGVPRKLDIPGLQHSEELQADPIALPTKKSGAPHGGAWFMDAMDVRISSETTWFGLKEGVMEGAGPMAAVLGPADWAHGIRRPVENVVADPNPNLNVQLLRSPIDHWIGVQPTTHWRPESGGGMGGGLLLDRKGVIGRVSMSVALTPFPQTK